MLLSMLKVSQLERKLALQRAYVQEANEQLQRKQTTAPNVDNKSADAPCDGFKRVDLVCRRIVTTKACLLFF